MIKTKNLSYQYENTPPLEFPNIELNTKETLLILGNSGAGKTTLLHLLGLLLKPSAGNLEINGTEITQLSNSKLTKFRAENLGMIFQKPHFVAALTVKENLQLANFFADKKLHNSNLLALAASLGFEKHLDKKLSQLSIGEQQRVAIARALANKPSIILADEPTSSLDDENCIKVIDLLKYQSESINASLIIVTHDYRLKSAFPNQITLKKDK